jgi:hypothetical protein
MERLVELATKTPASTTQTENPKRRNNFCLFTFVHLLLIVAQLAAPARLLTCHPDRLWRDLLFPEGARYRRFRAAAGKTCPELAEDRALSSP